MFPSKGVYHYNRLMATHIGMKHSIHAYDITHLTFCLFLWQLLATIYFQLFSLLSLLQFSNLQTMALMEMKLFANVIFFPLYTTSNRKVLCASPLLHFSKGMWQCIRAKFTKNGSNCLLSLCPYYSVPSLGTFLNIKLIHCHISLKSTHYMLYGCETW